MYSCAQGVLAADGRTWVDPGEVSPSEALRAAAAPFQVGGEVRPAPAWSPPAAPPATGRSALEATRECEASPEAWFNRGGGGGGVGRLGTRRDACAGLGCFPARPARDWSETHFLFSDAKCAGDDCRHGIERPPSSLAVGADGTLRVSRLPCAASQFIQGPGVALAVCPEADGGRPLWLADRRGVWTALPALPAVLGLALDVADDGTLLLAPACDAAGCRAFVRPPAPLDAAVGFTEVSEPRAVGYRAAEGGFAIAVAPSAGAGTAPPAVDLRGPFSEPDIDGSYWDPFTDSYYPPHPLVGLVERCFAAHPGDVGPGKGLVKIEVKVGVDGRLAEAPRITELPDGDVARCIAGAVAEAPLRKPPVPIRASRVLGWRADATGAALVALGADGARRVLAAALPLKGTDLLAVRTAKGQVVLTLAGKGSAEDFVLLADGSLRPETKR
jgi:hypothetical protein